jgi:integral membrane sensor domain MASE1
MWPAAGVGLAALVLSPRRQWPVILAVLFIAGNGANLVSGRAAAASLGFMTANLIESLACAWLIARWCGSGVRFTRIQEVLALMTSAVFVNAGSALLGAGTAALTNTSPFRDFWFTWWVADGLGILLVTPLIVAWSDFGNLFHKLRWYRVLES